MNSEASWVGVVAQNTGILKRKTQEPWTHHGNGQRALKPWCWEKWGKKRGRKDSEARIKKLSPANNQNKGPTRRIKIWMQCLYGGPLNCVVRTHRDDVWNAKSLNWRAAGKPWTPKHIAWRLEAWIATRREANQTLVLTAQDYWTWRI